MDRSKRKNKKTLLWIIGTMIVVGTSAVSLIPYFWVKTEPLAAITLIFSAFPLYVFIIYAMMLPVGVVSSSILGNRTTGFLTFAITGVAYAIYGDNQNIWFGFLAVLICIFVYDNKRFTKVINCVITILLLAGCVTGLLFVTGYLDELFLGQAYLATLWAAIGLGLIIWISALLERLPILRWFDEESHDLDHNYRVHSLNRKLILVINVICLILIVVFSSVEVVLLSQKEQAKETSENQIWAVLFQEALEEDADYFADRNYEKIEAAADKIKDAIGYGSIQTPASIGITTRTGEDEFILQLYEVTNPTEFQYSYAVEWRGEYQLTKEELASQVFVPNVGNSTISVSQKSRVKDAALAAIEKSFTIALLLMIFMNILVSNFIRKVIVKPINMMTTEAIEFAYRKEDILPKEERMEIHSGDEIESLSRAFHKTMDEMADYVEDVRAKSEEVANMQHNIIITMADIIESRDLNTGGHIKRTAIYVGIVAKRLMEEGQFTEILDDDYLSDMIVAAPLHDMGKIHVPDQILNKNGRLTDEEFEVMKSHASVGKQLLDTASESLGQFRYLVIAEQMAESHHEWWNGKGYPKGLSGEAIPLCARIMAVADVFDALVSKRCYKDPMDLDASFGIIEKETGTHFDPIVGKTFLACRPEVEDALAKLTEKKDEILPGE